ncbi:protein of unknown function UPF0066 [Methanolacinia petrolearia DSM 11571]|uniref:TsaA-like domain-containing protein n=1 Tax=Methanolacinia petrolearia (strain DSM 11571 / OCM 486 / SEBR 4847) TaxID=679926 RepID=E1RG33_METP4|nr:SAM-dependent methyltransferase [Methanolacinia petrolearia]ADN36268.1 protein of unknown function UPF0066 [Methanolacinia petrolearia DSM 11571]
MNDEAAVQAGCLNEFVLNPVGIIKNGIKTPPLVAGEQGLTVNESCESAIEKMANSPETLSEIILNDELEELLDGIDDYSHLVIVYWGHEIGDQGRKLKRIHPAGQEDYPLKGIYSTFSPARPNPVLVTVVKLIERDGPRLTVRGLDAIDNSPVLDIKPYVAELFSFKNTQIPGWITKILEEFVDESRK